MQTSLLEFIRGALVYVPLSLIGAWRWSFWIVRLTAARLYRPKQKTWPSDRPRPTVSLVTPVYNEDPVVFEQAIQSWIKNGVTEIIVVIDKSNTRHIVDLERRYVRRKDVHIRLVVTPKPGKRAALADGINRAKGQLIVLVDSDTIWGDKVLERSLPYFLDPAIGGATVGQRIQNPNTAANVMFDILLWTRYREEVPFLLAVGKVFNTLSGRTAFYRREALLNPNHDNLHDLRHELFLGTRGVSGDDKRLTHLILEQGWHVTYVTGAWVFTPGLGTVRQFMKQRLRWTRNSWRADLRAFKRGWVLKHPGLAIFMLDRFFQPFFMLLGPVACAVALYSHDWLAAGILAVWWMTSRFIRLFPYFKKYPARIIYLPAYIVYGYANAITKIYALATLLEHSWATRWHAYRMKNKRSIQKLVTVGGGALGVGLFLSLVTSFVLKTHNETGAGIKVPQAVQAAEFDGEISFASKAPLEPAFPPDALLPTGVKSYVVKPGDTLDALAQQFGTTSKELKKLNAMRDPDTIVVGQTLIYLDPASRGVGP